MEVRVLYLASVLALGIGAQWLAWRMRLPAILLLLAVGFAAGQIVSPGDPVKSDGEPILPDAVLFPIVSLSVAVILFEGGLSLQIRDLKETGRVVFRLITVGVLVSWLLTWAAVWFILGVVPTWFGAGDVRFDVRVAALVGAILVVSGPTVIVPLLRHVRPVRQVGSIVKWEGIVNDPIGAVLAVLVFEALLAAGSTEAATATPFEMVRALLGGLALTITAGGLLGLAAAVLLVFLLKRYWIPDFLQTAVFLAVVVGSFTTANTLWRESGLVTVTVLGLVLANQKMVTIKHVVEFKENLRVLLISTLFILLASRVEIADLRALGLEAIAFLAVLVLLVRPATVLLATLGTELKRPERLFLGWMAPRGIVAAAVSSLFALEAAKLAGDGELAPEIAKQIEQVVPLTFLVIVGTVAVYGLTAAPLARWLNLADAHPQGILFAGSEPWVREIGLAVQREGFQVLLVDTNHRNIAAARMAGLPTCSASILSEYVCEEVDLGGIGRLLALTPNDEVNSLAAMQLAGLFDRAEVYQLATETSGSQRHEPGAHLRGRLLFGDEVTYTYLLRRFGRGAVVKTTRLTDEFSYNDFQQLYGRSAVVLFVVEESGKLSVATADTAATPGPGQTLIGLVDPPPEDKPLAAVEAPGA